MKSIGSFLVLIGILSIALHFIGWNVRLLMWIDNWGNLVGWLIRGGVIVVGAAFYFIGSRREA
jgi:hypothetical protein